MKKLMLLGGLRYLIPVIKTAQEMGIYVITCDYIPNNIAHQYSNEYHNINIVDKEAVLELASKLKIDGILSFAVDPGVITAAFVASNLGLPSPPYESVKILQNKALFRKFLKDNGFNVPIAKGFQTYEESLNEISIFKFPIIVKPVDSAGSKGVSRVDNIEQLKDATQKALMHNIKDKYFIIEEFIQHKGFSSDSDCFSINSDLCFISFSDQYFDNSASNPYTPAAFSWPSTMDLDHQTQLSSELKRLVKLLDLGTSIYNVETRISIDNIPYIMEVSPRGGGNRLSEMLKFATNIDLIKSCIKYAVDIPSISLPNPSFNGYWGEIILHSKKSGIFDKITIAKSMIDNIVEIDMWVKSGDKINTFNAANDAIGTLILSFDTRDQLEKAIQTTNDWLSIDLL